MAKAKLEMRVLHEGDLKQFRRLRLEGLKDHPESFLGSYEEEKEKPDSYFLDLIDNDKVVGCFSLESGKMLGIGGFYILTPTAYGKRAHTAKMWGVYVNPEYRGRGFAKKMVQRVLDEASKQAEKVLIKVHAKNHRALRFYKQLGFMRYGYEVRSLKIKGKYYDDVLLSKFLDS